MKMKTFSLLAASLFLLAACNSGNGEEKTPEGDQPATQQVDPAVVNNPMTADQPEADPNDPTLPVLSFEKEIYEFPKTITEGEKVSYSFKFTNTGKSDLIISDAKAQCGCTIPTFSKEPIPPGGKGRIDVEYNSEGRGGGRHEKALTVTSNSIPKSRELRIVVNVNPKQAE